MSGDHAETAEQLDRRVDDGLRLGRVGQGFAIALETLDRFRVTVGAAAVGLARRALDEALHRASVRHQFGRPLVEQPQIQAYLADMRTELDAARLLVLRAACRADGLGEAPGREVGREVRGEEAAIAKLYATEAAQRIIDHAVQIHGGLGVLRGVAVERLYREVRALRIYEGTTEIQKVVIASRMAAAEQARRAAEEPA